MVTVPPSAATAPRDAREWLDVLLGGHVPREGDLQQLVRDCPTENDLVEYKAAAWVLGLKAAADLRDYVAAFANVSGGIIVLGYDRAGTRFDDVKPPGRASVEDWIATSTASLRPYFHLPPRQWIVSVAGSSVGVIVVPRAPTLIPILNGSVRRYPMRWGASVEYLPEDLALDILIGRRRNPFQTTVPARRARLRRPHGRGSLWDGGVPESHIPSVERPREVLCSSEMVAPEEWHGI